MAAFTPRDNGGDLPPSNPEDSAQAHDADHGIPPLPSRKRASYTPSVIRHVCNEFLMFFGGLLAVATVLVVPIALRVAQNMIPVQVKVDDPVDVGRTYKWWIWWAINLLIIWQLVGVLQLFYIRDHRNFSFKYLAVGLLFVAVTLFVTEVLPRWRRWLPLRFYKQGVTAALFLVFAIPYLCVFARQRPYQDVTPDEEPIARENVMRHIRRSVADFVKKLLKTDNKQPATRTLRSSVVQVQPRHGPGSSNVEDPLETSRSVPTERRGAEHTPQASHDDKKEGIRQQWCGCSNRRNKERETEISQAARLQTIGSTLDMNPLKFERYMALRRRRATVLSLGVIMPLFLYSLFIVFVLLFQDWSKDVGIIRLLLGGALSLTGFLLRGVFNEWLFVYALREANFLCCECRRTDIWDWNINTSASPFLALFFEMMSKLFVLSVTPVTQRQWVFWLLLLFKCLGIYAINVAWVFPVTQRFFPDTPAHFVWHRTKRYQNEESSPGRVVQVEDLLSSTEENGRRKSSLKHAPSSNGSYENGENARSAPRRKFSFSQQSIKHGTLKPGLQLSINAKEGVQDFNASPDKVRDLFRVRRAERRMSHRDSAVAIQALLDAGWLPQHHRLSDSPALTRGDDFSGIPCDVHRSRSLGATPRRMGSDETKAIPRQNSRSVEQATGNDEEIDNVTAMFSQQHYWTPEKSNTHRMQNDTSERTKNSTRTLYVDTKAHYEFSQSSQRNSGNDEEDEIDDDLTEEALDGPVTNRQHRFSAFSFSSSEGGMTPMTPLAQGNAQSVEENNYHGESKASSEEQADQTEVSTGNQFREEKDDLDIKSLTVHRDEDVLILKQKIHALRRRYKPKTRLFRETKKYPKWIAERAQRLFVQLFAEMGAALSYMAFAYVYTRGSYFTNGSLFPLGRLNEEDFNDSMVLNGNAIALFTGVFIACFFLLRSMYGVNIFKTGADLFANTRYAIAFSTLVLVIFAFKDHIVIEPAEAQINVTG
eukprot:gb/GECG01000731.1/.p1 GENE.gb/GECG01000731.1/~~gb/GECG01000731.1/.p1  ORF type:complete len:990 (+),score=85.67 gb/GECG01000731.1/:1-2970(+)